LSTNVTGTWDFTETVAYGCTTVDERAPAGSPAAATMVPSFVVGILPFVREGGVAAMPAGEDGVGSGVGQGGAAQEAARPEECPTEEGCSRGAPIRGGCPAMNTPRREGEEKVWKEGLGSSLILVS